MGVGHLRGRQMAGMWRKLISFGVGALLGSVDGRHVAQTRIFVTQLRLYMCAGALPLVHRAPHTSTN